jgi:hypothetical protein
MSGNTENYPFDSGSSDFESDDNRDLAGTDAGHRESDERPAIRVGTVVWGLVIVALGTLLVVVQQAGLRLDAGQVVIWLLLGAGVAMVVGGAASAARRRSTRQ